MKEIAIERALFGDYWVAVYEDQQLLLDNKYFVNSLEAAMLVADKLQKQEEYKDYKLTIY